MENESKVSVERVERRVREALHLSNGPNRGEISKQQREFAEQLAGWLAVLTGEIDRLRCRKGQYDRASATHS